MQQTPRQDATKSNHTPVGATASGSSPVMLKQGAGRSFAEQEAYLKPGGGGDKALQLKPGAGREQSAGFREKLAFWKGKDESDKRDKAGVKGEPQADKGAPEADKDAPGEPSEKAGAAAPEEAAPELEKAEQEAEEPEQEAEEPEQESPEVEDDDGGDDFETMSNEQQDKRATEQHALIKSEAELAAMPFEELENHGNEVWRMLMDREPERPKVLKRTKKERDRAVVGPNGSKGRRIRKAHAEKNAKRKRASKAYKNRQEEFAARYAPLIAYEAQLSERISEQRQRSQQDAT